VSVGAEVAAARRACGLTIDDVSEATRVRATVLRHIEADDFSLCGGNVYARGHLRAICTVVDLDSAPLLATFDTEQGARPPRVTSDAMADTNYQESRHLNWTLLMSVALVAVLGFVGFRFLTVGQDQPSGSTTAAVAQPPASERASVPPTTSKPATAVPPQAILPTDAVAAGASVQMVLRTAQGRSWVQVSGSKGVLFSGVIEKNSSRRFVDGERLSIVVGNAAAVSLTVNGEDLGASGPAGRVARLTFGPGNPNQG